MVISSCGRRTPEVAEGLSEERTVQLGKTVGERCEGKTAVESSTSPNPENASFLWKGNFPSKQSVVLL